MVTNGCYTSLIGQLLTNQWTCKGFMRTLIFLERSAQNNDVFVSMYGQIKCSSMFGFG